MKAIDAPLKFPKPFADSAGPSYKNAIPTASQIGIVDGRASLTDGFPPLNFTQLVAGGIPPFGGDVNGLLNQVTDNEQWANAGGYYKYDSAFSTAIGGYPKGAVILNATNDGLWFSAIDDNTTDPDAGPSVNWGMLPTLYNSPGQFAQAFVNQTVSTVVMALADSNGEGVGAGAYNLGYLGKAIRGIMNVQDKGEACDRGFRYETVLNLSLAGLDGISGTGTLANGPNGMLSVRISLAAGQYIEVTNREISSCDVFYDSAASTGSLLFSLNGGATYRTTAISTGSTIKTTYNTPSTPGYIFNGDLYRYTRPTDVVRITASGGTVVVTGYLFIRTSSSGSLVFSSPKQGYGFDDFANASVVAERCQHWDSIYNNTTPRLLLVLLGTNNMIDDVSKQKTPANYITALDTMIEAYKTTSTSLNKSYAVWVPPRPNKTLLLGRYEEYVKAIVDYCKLKGIHCIRCDLSGLGNIVPSYFADFIHYGAEGQDVLGRFVCESLRYPAKFGIPVPLPGIKNTISFAGTTPWASSGGAFALRSSSGQNDNVLLTGKAQSNASASLTMCNIPANCRPLVDRNFLVWADGLARGATLLASNGNIVLAAGAIPAVVSLDGVSYPMRD